MHPIFRPGYWLQTAVIVFTSLFLLVAVKTWVYDFSFTVAAVWVIATIFLNHSVGVERGYISG